MGRKVKSYTEEYKNTIIDLFNSGKTYAEISDEYGVPKTTIRQWVKKNNTASDDNISNNDAEIKAMKKRIVEMMGGQCEICGYNKCLDALEFHHKDPSKKDFQICCTGGCPSFERLLEEAKKCQLLCANCHREEHWRLRQKDK